MEQVIIETERRYIVNMDIPHTPQTKGMERRASVLRMHIMYPQMEGSKADVDIVTVYNAPIDILSPVMDDEALPHREKLLDAHQKCIEVLEKQSYLPCDRRYAHEFIYIRYIDAKADPYWDRILKDLPDAVNSNNGALRARRFFYQTMQIDTKKNKDANVDEMVAQIMQQNSRENLAQTLDPADPESAEVIIEQSYHKPSDKHALEVNGFTQDRNGIMYRVNDAESEESST